METDPAYFRRRAKEERETGMKAPDSRARRAHLEMAQRYDERVSTLKRPQPPSEVSQGSDG